MIHDGKRGKPMKTRVTTILFVVISLFPAIAWTQSDGESPPQLMRPALEQVSLVDVLGAVRRHDDKTFLVDHRVPPAIVIGQVDIDDIDYPMLLIILRNNDLAVVNADGIVNIVPVGIVRQYPLPVLFEADDSVHDEEWVTWIVQTRNASPQSVVPIIRPIMPQAGHFAADPGSQSILIVDRYGNAKRIVALIEQFDAATPPGN
jgi:general secretion pathway protein D